MALPLFAPQERRGRPLKLALRVLDDAGLQFVFAFQEGLLSGWEDHPIGQKRDNEASLNYPYREMYEQSFP